MNNRLTCALFAPIAVSVGVLFAQPADTGRNPLASSQVAAIDGQRVYDATCQACHGPAGQGDRERGGPALNVPRLARGDEDADLFRNIRSGIPGTQMPPFARLTDQQTWQVISYIRSLQGTALAATAAGGSMAAGQGDPAAGEALFFGRAECSTCHEVNARGGVTGPDPSSAGRLTAAVLRQKIAAPNDPLPAAPGGRGGPPPVTVVVRTLDGREIRGVRRNEDTYSLQIVDATGSLHLLDKLRLKSVTVENRSLMPGDYATRLSATDMANLVAYLRAQEGRDLSKTIAAPMAGGVTYERLRNANAEPHNWLMYWGDYQGTHFSALNHITAGNVQRLQPAWSFPILGGNSILEGTPLVVDGVMYTTGSGNPATVAALDARTGRQNLAMDATAEGREPVRDQPIRPRRVDSQQQSVCRHA